MSGGTPCRCRHLAPQVRRLHWRVVDRQCNYSAFNGYKRTFSNWSGIVCLICDGTWRSQAAYVMALPDMSPSERGARK